MQDVRGRSFTGGEQVQVDDTNFIECTFDGAQLRYAGGEMPSFQGCNIPNASWYFEGAALRTIQLLQALANQEGGGRAFIDDLFKPGNFIGE